MTGRLIRLTLRHSVREPIDASVIAADGFDGLDQFGIESVRLTVNHESAALGEIFTVQLSPSDGCVDLEITAGQSVHHLGARQRRGTMVVQSHAGDHVASPVGSSAFGMSGGTILIRGNAGDRVAHRLRRGTVIVLGDCGLGTASLAVAGTVVIAGKTGDLAGFGMRRGTLVTRQPPGPGWSSPRRLRTPFAPLLAEQLPADAALQPIREAIRGGGVTTRRGDVRVGGQAEWWHFGEGTDGT